jgi:cell division protein FtsL
MIAERPRSATATRTRARVHAAPSTRSPARRGSVTEQQRQRRDREPNAPMAQRGPRALRHARQLRWRSPETVAVLAASFSVSLLLLYVAAYARVTAEGFEAAALSRKLRAAEKEQDALKVRIGELRTPEQVAKRAQSIGMVPGTPENVNLVTAAATVPATASASVPVGSSPVVDRPF